MVHTFVSNDLHLTLQGTTKDGLSGVDLYCVLRTVVIVSNTLGFFFFFPIRTDLRYYYYRLCRK